MGIFTLAWAALAAWFSAVPARSAIMVPENAVRLWRAWSASRAIIVQPVFAIKPGRGQLGMADAAPANERELDWPDLVHYLLVPFSNILIPAGEPIFLIALFIRWRMRSLHTE